MKRQELSLSSISPAGAARQLLQNWWVVVCLALAMLLGATGLGMLTYTPQYTASATLVIRAMGSDTYTSLIQTTQMTAVYSEVFQSTALRNLIAESTGEEVQGSISCTQIEETNLLVLRTTSPTPRQAYLFISSALDNYEQIAGYLFTDATLEIVQEPSVPQSPSNTSPLISHRLMLTALAAVGGAALILLIYLLRNTLKVAGQASNLLDGTVLGVVPYERKRTSGGRHTRRKKGVPALLLTSPRVSMDFAEASRRTATRLEARLQRKGFQVLTVASVEENEGKSTVAANIAIALAERGRRVLLLDGDFRKPAQFRIFGERGGKRHSLSDVLAGQVDWSDALNHNDRSGVQELFQYKAVKDPVTLLNSPKLGQLMEQLRSEMDYILIDCSPVAAAADAELWMRYADTGVLVVRQDRADVRVVNDTVDLIWKSAGDFSGFVLNGFQSDGLNRSRSGRYGAY